MNEHEVARVVRDQFHWAEATPRQVTAARAFLEAHIAIRFESPNEYRRVRRVPTVLQWLVPALAAFATLFILIPGVGADHELAECQSALGFVVPCQRLFALASAVGVGMLTGLLIRMWNRRHN